jgi:hypothetical protein
MIFLVGHLLEYLCSLGLEFVALSVGNMCNEFWYKKTCLVVLKILCTHFRHLWFFTKIFMHNYIRMWKITTTMQIIIILIIQYFSLKFIQCRFYIWKITKTKSLSIVSKRGTLIVNMPSWIVTINKSPLIWCSIE